MYDVLNRSRQYADTVKKVAIEPELDLLIRDCIAGSEVARRKLYERYSPVIYGTIKRYLYKEDTAAGELLNDAFLKIFAKLGQYSFQGAFEGWMRRIVINTLTDHLRKKIKDDRQILEIKAESVYTSANGLDNISYKELLELVQGLPDTQRTVFNLFVFEQYTHKEIGELLNLKENNCRWHLSDARNRLKEQLKQLTIRENNDNR